MTIMGIAISLACALVLAFLPMPLRASWPFLAGSALLHVGYNAFLIRATAVASLARISHRPRIIALLVTLGAAAAAGESPSPHGIAGIVLVSGGIISLAFRGRRLPEAGIFYALGTGIIIAAYSVTDGIGGRLSGNPTAYTLWMCLLWGLTAVPIYLVRRRDGRLWRGAGRDRLRCPGRRGFASGLRHRHLRHDARAHGLRIRLAGDQCPVRGSAGAAVFC